MNRESAVLPVARWPSPSQGSSRTSLPFRVTAALLPLGKQNHIHVAAANAEASTGRFFSTSQTTQGSSLNRKKSRLPSGENRAGPQSALPSQACISVIFIRSKRYLPPRPEYIKCLPPGATIMLWNSRSGLLWRSSFPVLDW